MDPWSRREHESERTRARGRRLPRRVHGHLPALPAGPPRGRPSFTRAIGGAETNVACALAAAGHRAKWVGRVGRDGFGDHLLDVVGGHGVDVTAVGRDPHRPTGIYFRTDEDRATDAHEVVYYRAGSAASAMSPATVPYESVAGARILHLTGITAALSGDCLALLRELTAPRPGRPLVSFDVNHRPALWRDGDAPAYSSNWPAAPTSSSSARTRLSGCGA